MKKFILSIVVILLCLSNSVSARNRKIGFGDLRYKDSKEEVIKKLQDHWGDIDPKSPKNCVSADNYSYRYHRHRQIFGKVDVIFDGNRIGAIEFYPMYVYKKNNEKKNHKDLNRYIKHFDKKYLRKENRAQLLPSDPKHWESRNTMIDYDPSINQFRFYSNGGK